MIIKHRICKNTVTDAIYGISQVCKNFSFTMLTRAGAILEASELRGEPPLALHRSGLVWNLLSGGQVRAEARLAPACLIAPGSQMDMEPL